MAFDPNTVAVPETPENLAKYREGRFALITRMDGTTFIGKVLAVDPGQPGGVMLVRAEDANAGKDASGRA